MPRKAIAGLLPARQRATLPLSPALRDGEQVRLLTASKHLRLIQVTATTAELENVGEHAVAYLLVIATPTTETALDVFELAQKVLRRFARKPPPP